MALLALILLTLGAGLLTSPMAQASALTCEVDSASSFRAALQTESCDIVKLTSSDYLIAPSAGELFLTIDRPVIIEGQGVGQTRLQLATGILLEAPAYPPNPDSIDPDALLCDVGEICTSNFPWMRVELRDVSISTAIFGFTPITNDGALLTLERVRISDSEALLAGALLNLRGNVWVKDSRLEDNRSVVGGAITNAPVTLPDTFGVTDLINLATISTAYSTDLQDGTLDSSFDLYPGGSLPFTLVTNTDIVANQAETLGGGISNSFGTVLIVNSRVANNKVEFFSGAMGGGLANVLGVAVVADSVFQDNVAAAELEVDLSILGGPFTDLSSAEVGGSTPLTYASAGGAIYSQTGVLVVQRTDFFANQARSATVGSRGGAIFAGSALPSPANDASASYLEDVTILDSRSGGGGAVLLKRGTHTIRRAFMADNVARGILSGAQGGAILVQNADLTLEQVTLARNTAQVNGEGGGIAFLATTQEGDIRELNVRNSTFSENVAESSTGFFGNGGGVYVFSGISCKIDVATKSCLFDDGEDVVRPTQDEPRLLLEHTTFYANVASGDGAHYFAGSTTGLESIDITVRGSVFDNADLPSNDNDCFLMPGTLGTSPITKTEEFSFAPNIACGGGGGAFTEGYDLQPLALNGRTVPTHLPSETSSLIDRIQCFSNVDQRGLARPFQAKPVGDPADSCDPGAVEYAGYELVPNFSPGIHATDVSADAEIVLTFRDPLSSAVGVSTESVSGDSVVVDSDLRGRISGAFSFSNGDRTVRFSPDQPWLAGERVRVVVTSRVKSQRGVPLSIPIQWSFTAGNGAPPHCVGSFRSAGASFPKIGNGSSRLADIDDDGDLDLVLTGSTGTFTRVSRIYRNNQGSFELFGEFEGMQRAGLAWGDVDGDGLPDLAATGRTGPKLSATEPDDLFSSGLLTLEFDGLDAAITTLPLLDFSALAFGDMDADGFLDLLMTGLADPDPVAKSIRNRSGRLGTTLDLLESREGLHGGKVFIGDIDNDYDLDIVMSGYVDLDTALGAQVWVLRNTGVAFEKTEEWPIGDPKTLLLADINGDGFLDMLQGKRRYLSRAQGNGLFSFDGDIDLGDDRPSFLTNRPVLEFADVNGDEAPDLVVLDRFFAGGIPVSTDIQPQGIRVLLNHDDGKFDGSSEAFSAELPIPYSGESRIEWGDIDGDGDQDALVIGRDLTQVFYQERCEAIDDLYEVVSVDPQSTGSPDLLVGPSGVLRNDKAIFPRSAVLEGDVSHGVLDLFPDGSFHYTPEPLFNGTDQFSYRLQSSGILSEPAVVSIDVLADPDYACYATSDDGTFVHASNDASALAFVLSNTPAGGTVKVAGSCVGVTPRGESSETLFIDKDVAILGGYDRDDWMTPRPETFPTVLSADSAGRVVVVAAGSQVLLRNLNLSDGTALTGAGIFNGGDLTLEGSSVTGNTGQQSGGGIYSEGNLTLRESLVALNTAPTGGGMYVAAGSLDVEDSTVSSNQADDGAGLWLNHPASAVLSNATVAFNEASVDGGGLWLATEAAAVSIQNSVLSDNAGGDCAGFLPESNGYNIDSDGSCNLSGTGDSTADPLLRPLQDNGGPTLTHALPVNSPAIDAGNPALPGSDPAACGLNDQRGELRTGTNSCDIGAYEAAIQQPCFAHNPRTLVTYDTGGSSILATAVAEADPGDLILLSGYCTGSATIDKSLHIRGGYDAPDWDFTDPDAFPTTYDALGRRGLLVDGASELTIEGLTLTNGAGVVASAGDASNGTLTIRNSRVLANLSAAPAIDFNGNTFRLEASVVRGNAYTGDAEFPEGIIHLDPASRSVGMAVTVVDSVIHENEGASAIDLDGGSIFTDPLYAIGAERTSIEIVDSSITENLGGAMNVRDVGSLTFTNADISGNTAQPFRGSALELENRLVPFTLSITGGSFSDNSSSDSGAINIVGWGDTSVIDAHFENNEFLGRGGGAVSWRVGIAGLIGPEGTLGPSTMLVQNSRFIGNSGGLGGGALAFVNRASQPALDVVVHDSWFEANGVKESYTAPEVRGGGAIELRSDDLTLAPINASVSGSTFIANTAFAGGAVRAERIDELEILESTFLANEAKGQSGGGITTFLVDRLSVATSSFTRNIAHGNGGAIRAVAPDFTLNAVSIIDNVAGAAGGGVVVDFGHLDMINSTVSGNMAICLEPAEVCKGTYQGVPYGAGGGIAFSPDGSGRIALSSLVDNQASELGGGLFAGPGAAVELGNTVLSGNALSAGDRDFWGVAATGIPFVADASSLAIDPLDPQIVYAGTNYGVFGTADGGATWDSLNTGLTNPTFANPRLHSIAIDPSNPQVLYAGSANGGGVFKSDDGGENWGAINTGLPDLQHVRALAIDPGAPSTVYAGADLGFFKSTDGGANWTAFNMDFENAFGRVARLQDLEIDPSDHQTIYAATNRGVYVSSDGGINWTLSNTGMGPVAPYVHSLAIDPSNPSTVYAGAGSDRGVFKSVDGGANWSEVNSGLTVTTVHSLAIDPANPATLYAGTDVGVFRTIDGGAAWAALSTGLRPNTVVNDVAIDPVTVGTLYAGTDNISGVSQPETVYKSFDRGGTCYDQSGAAFGSTGYNLEDQNQCGFDQATDIIATEALLEPLADNGGFTLTHAPRDGSPLLDAGDCLGDTVTVDQTGKARPLLAACDIGAYEGLAFVDRLTTTTLTANPSSSVVGQPIDLTAAVANTQVTPNGLVVFYDGAAELGSAMLDGNGLAVLVIDALEVGSRQLRADYQGTGRFDPSSGQLSHPVDLALTVLEIYAATPQVGQAGDPVTFFFNLTVSAPGSGEPAGIIVLRENGSELCRSTLPATSCDAVLAAPGFSVVTAEYLGSGRYAGALSEPWVQRVTERLAAPPPAVEKIGTVADTGDNVLLPGELTGAPISQLLVTFTQDMFDPAGDDQVGDITNSNSYRLVAAVDASAGFNTFTCDGGAVAPDTGIPVNSVTWNAGSATAELFLNDGAPLPSGSYLLVVCDTLTSSLLSNLDGNADGLPGGSALHPFEVDVTPPRVLGVSTVPSLPFQVDLRNRQELDFIPQGLVVTFDEDIQDPLGAELPDDASNPANYLLFSKGDDDIFSTRSCARGISSSDRQIALAEVVVSGRAASISIPPGSGIAPGDYRLMVCGTTTIVDLAGNALDGNGNGVGGDDFRIRFAISESASTVTAVDDFYRVAEGEVLDVAASAGLLANDANLAPVPLSVLDLNGDPGLVGAPFSLAEGGNVSVAADGSFSFDTEADFEALEAGEERAVTFSYGAGDGSTQASATVTITVIGGENPVVAQPDSFETFEDQGVSGNVLDDNGAGEDTGADFDEILTVAPAGTLVADGIGGTVTLNDDGSFQYAPPADANGTATFGYSVTDGIESSDGIVTINVLPVNDAPSFSAGPDQLVSLRAGLDVSVPGWATGVEAGPEDEADQALGFDVAVDEDPDGVVVSVSVDPDGTLDYSLTGALGSAMVEVLLMDDGGTESGGVDTSSPQRFTITVEDSPEADISVSKDDGLEVAENGALVDYVIVVSNSSSEHAAGIGVTDIMPTSIVGVSWICEPAETASCTGAGAGDLIDTVDLPGGTSVTYTVTGTIDAGDGTLIENTVVLAIPDDILDTNAEDNAATDRTRVGELVFVDGFEAIRDSVNALLAKLLQAPLTPIPVGVEDDGVRLHVRQSHQLEIRFSRRDSMGRWQPGPWQPLEVEGGVGVLRQHSSRAVQRVQD